MEEIEKEIKTEIKPLEDSELDDKSKVITDSKPAVKYFECSSCSLREKYEYFGNAPPWVKDYKLQENAYIIEDPFLPPKRGEFLVLGTNCIKCTKAVCKDSNCSFYFSGTYCIKCAKDHRYEFPKSVQEKLNRIVVP